MPLNIESFDLIIGDIFEGETLIDALKKRQVNRHAFYAFLQENVIHAEKYARARQAQADLFVEQLITIADDENIDANRARNMLDVRKWTASKLMPATYGDRIEVNHKVEASISDALEDARKRTLPLRDLSNVIDVQPTEVTTLGDSSATGSKPVTPNENDNVAPKEQSIHDEIF